MHREEHRRVHPVRGRSTAFAAQVDGLCRRFEEELGPVHGRGHRWAGRSDRPPDQQHRPSRAVAHPRRPAHHLRPQHRALAGRSGATRRMARDIPYRFDRDRHGRRAAGPLRRRCPPGRRPGSRSPSPAGSCCAGSRASWPSAPLRDSTGAIQLFAGAAWTERFDGFRKLSLGDWIGATGEVVKHPHRRAVGQGRPRGCCSPRPGAASATSGGASPTSTSATASATPTCGPTSGSPADVRCCAAG